MTELPRMPDPPPVGFFPNVNEDPAGARAAMIDWFTQEAWRLPAAKELIIGTCDRLIACGLPLTVFNIHLVVLHPSYFGFTHRWRRGVDGVETRPGNHANYAKPVVQSSPIAELRREGYHAIRRRLTDAHQRADYPILKDYWEQGGRDYVILRMEFQDGSIHTVSLVGDRDSGFTVAELALVDSLLFYLARLTEGQMYRYITTTLLDTYVGQRTGERILDGRIQRGDSEYIDAVIWLTDLRGFTRLSNELHREALLDLLNSYFDLVGAAVTDAGGEILKFIGDAILAIQPIDSPEQAANACERAITAARAMQIAVLEANRLRSEASEAPIDFGLALHIGRVLYGNIGSRNRLDFTVLGPAVNEAARLESLCGELGEPILLSESFVGTGAIAADSLGAHPAKGLDAPIQVFRPRPSYSAAR